MTMTEFFEHQRNIAQRMLNDEYITKHDHDLILRSIDDAEHRYGIIDKERKAALAQMSKMRSAISEVREAIAGVTLA